MSTPAGAQWTTGPGAFRAAHDDRYEASLRPFTAHLLRGAGIRPRPPSCSPSCAPTMGRPCRQRAAAALHAALVPYETSDGVLLRSSAWLVTATRR